MNDSPRPSNPVRATLRRLFRWLRHPLSTELSARREYFADLLRQAARIQTLDDLLIRFPEHLREGMAISGLHVFLVRQGRKGQVEYCLAAATKDQVCFAGSSAVVARMKRERWPSLFAEDAAKQPEAWQLLATAQEVAQLRALGAQLLFPLAGHTRLAGFVVLARSGQLPFSRAELRFFRDLGPRLGHGVENALLIERLSEEAVERDRSRRELSLAREVQEHLLPVSLPRLPGIELASFYQSAAEVGGDYFDAFVTPSGALCLVIADVSGKGVPAALMMAALRASLHALALHDIPLERLTSQLDQLLFASSPVSRYATMFIARYDRRRDTLEFCNAGHNPPVLIHPNGDLQRLTEGGSVLGLLPGGTYQTRTVPFPTGSTLVLYTDGVTEAPGPQDSEWSEEQLHQALQNISTRHAQTVLERIQVALQRFAGETPPADDQTMLVLSAL